jgi:hypothetical protein
MATHALRELVAMTWNLGVFNYRDFKLKKKRKNKAFFRTPGIQSIMFF